MATEKSEMRGSKGAPPSLIDTPEMDALGSWPATSVSAGAVFGGREIVEEAEHDSAVRRRRILRTSIAMLMLIPVALSLLVPAFPRRVRTAGSQGERATVTRPALTYDVVLPKRR